MADPVTGDGLLRWIVGGLVIGAAVLGLMVAAYTIGYERGEDSAAGPAETAPPPVTEPETTMPPETTETTETEPVGTGESEADLAARGEALWGSSGCAGCHSVDGSDGVGPTMQGLAGSTVTLDDGSSATADDAYLARAITDPDAEVSEGYDAGVMAGAVASQGFDGRPEDVAALVAYIRAQG